MSGYGAGVEDWNLRIGKVAVGFLSAARPDIVTNNGNYAKSNADVRFYDLKGPFGLWGVWFDYAIAKGGSTPSGTAIPTTDGYAFGLRHLNGREAITRFPFSTARAQPVISARPSRTRIGS
jgi:maltoporin